MACTTLCYSSTSCCCLGLQQLAQCAEGFAQECFSIFGVAFVNRGGLNQPVQKRQAKEATSTYSISTNTRAYSSIAEYGHLQLAITCGGCGLCMPKINVTLQICEMFFSATTLYLKVTSGIIIILLLMLIN